MNQPMFQSPVDVDHVRESLRVMHRPGDVFEVRALEAKINKAYRPVTVSGYFDDPEQAALSVQPLTMYSGIYITLNPVLPDLLARANNRLKEAGRGATTSDKDVTARRWLLVDCDPVRATGISSSDDEHRMAAERAKDIDEALFRQGWPAAVKANSGNGTHLLYRIDLPNDDASTDLIRRCLAALGHGFSDPQVSVDQTVFNAARLVKLYGTRAQKGDSTEARPHRMARLIDPETGPAGSVERSLLEQLASWAPGAIQQPVMPDPGGGAWTEDRLARWLDERGIHAGPPSPWQGKSRRVLETCPLCHESDKSAAVFIDPTGQLGFVCHHNRCAGKGWVELRKALEPERELPKPDPGVDLSGLLRPKPPSIFEWPKAEVTALEVQEEPAEPAIPDPGPVTESMLEVPGFIRSVMDYTLETAPYPNPVLAFAGALALQAVLAGRKVRDPGNNRTNLYILGLAASGTGKDHPRQVNVEILSKIGMARVLSSQFASGEGLEDALAVSPVRLCQTDEIDGILQAINKSKDARHEALMRAFLTMYSSAGTAVPLRQKAGDTEPAIIDQPCLVLFGTAIPNNYYGALSERMLTNGFVSRMLILECGNRGEGQELEVTSVPDHILSVASWWRDQPFGPGNLGTRNPQPRVVPFTSEGREIVATVRKNAEREYNLAQARGNDVGMTIWTRVSQEVRKLALIYAISRDHEAPEIDGDAVVWAETLVSHQARRTMAQAAQHVAETDFEVKALKALRAVRARGGRIERSRLLKAMKMQAKLEFDPLIATLIDRRDLAIEEVRTGGRLATWYTLPKTSPVSRETCSVESNNKYI